MERRIAIYFNERKPFAQIQFNHAITKKISKLIEREGISKTKFAERALKEGFKVENTEELKERIIYASNTMEVKGQGNQRIATVCKTIMKRVIDSY